MLVFWTWREAKNTNKKQNKTKNLEGGGWGGGEATWRRCQILHLRVTVCQVFSQNAIFWKKAQYSDQENVLFCFSEKTGDRIVR